MVTTRMVSGRNGTRPRRTFIAIARTRANRSFLGHDDPVAVCIFLRTGDEDDHVASQEAWNPTSQDIDGGGGDDDADIWAEKYLLERIGDDDEDDETVAVGCAHQAKHAQRNRHITDVDEFPLAFGNWGYRQKLQKGSFLQALNGCYTCFTATGKNSAKADILSKIVWKVDPVCTRLSCPKITGEFVGSTTRFVLTRAVVSKKLRARPPSSTGPPPRPPRPPPSSLLPPPPSCSRLVRPRLAAPRPSDGAPPRPSCLAPKFASPPGHASPATS